MACVRASVCVRRTHGVNLFVTVCVRLEGLWCAPCTLVCSNIYTRNTPKCKNIYIYSSVRLEGLWFVPCTLVCSNIYTRCVGVSLARPSTSVCAIFHAHTRNHSLARGSLVVDRVSKWAYAGLLQIC